MLAQTRGKTPKSEAFAFKNPVVFRRDESTRNVIVRIQTLRKSYRVVSVNVFFGRFVIVSASKVDGSPYTGAKR